MPWTIYLQITETSGIAIYEPTNLTSGIKLSSWLAIKLKAPTYPDKGVSHGGSHDWCGGSYEAQEHTQANVATTECFTHSHPAAVITIVWYS